MRPNGPTPEQPLSLPAAIVVTLSGIAAMFAGGFLGAAFRLGLPATLALGTALLAVPALLAFWSNRPALRAALGRTPTRRVTAPSVLLGGAAWLASVGLLEMQSLLLPPTGDYLDGMRGLHRALAPTGPIDAVVSLVVIAVLPSLCEELVVRGTLLPSLATRMPASAAVLASAGLFALMHWDRYRFLFAFSIGIAFGVLRLHTRSLWPGVFGHATLNTLTFLLAPLLDDPSQAYQPEPVLGLACLLAGGALAVPLWRRLEAQGPSAGSSHT